MKSLLVLASLTLTTPAHAGVIAQVDYACGFMCADNTSRTVHILDDGTIESSQGSNHSDPHLVTMGKLSPATLAKIQQQVAEIEFGELVKRGKGPGCEDAPSTTYFARHNGNLEKIGQEAACQTYVLPSYEGQDLVGLLHSFLAYAPF